LQLQVYVFIEKLTPKPKTVFWFYIQLRYDSKKCVILVAIFCKSINANRDESVITTVALQVAIFNVNRFLSRIQMKSC